MDHRLLSLESQLSLPIFGGLALLGQPQLWSTVSRAYSLSDLQLSVWTIGMLQSGNVLSRLRSTMFEITKACGHATSSAPTILSPSLGHLVQKASRIRSRMHTFLPLFLMCVRASALTHDAPVIRGRRPEGAIVERIACNSDNVLRALKANSVAASPFCSSFIDIPDATAFKSVAGVTATT